MIMAKRTITNMKITPEVASELLKGNINNRKPNKDYVSSLASIMRKGDWRSTHQGICIGKDDRLIDGQQRLMAVIESGVTVLMDVTYDDSFEEPRDPSIDRGKIRSASWQYDCEKRLWETAVAIVIVGQGMVSFTLGRTGNPSHSLTRRIAEEIEPIFSKLVKKYRTGFSSSKIRAAVILAVLLNRDQEDEIIDQFNKLMTDDREGMWNIVIAFEREIVGSMIDDKKRKLNQFYMMVKMFKALSEVGIRRSLQKNVINSFPNAIEELKQLILSQFKVQFTEELPAPKPPKESNSRRKRLQG